jgi:hypothetical protein
MCFEQAIATFSQIQNSHYRMILWPISRDKSICLTCISIERNTVTSCCVTSTVSWTCSKTVVSATNEHRSQSDIRNHKDCFLEDVCVRDLRLTMLLFSYWMLQNTVLSDISSYSLVPAYQRFGRVEDLHLIRWRASRTPLLEPQMSLNWYSRKYILILRTERIPDISL